LALVELEEAPASHYNQDGTSRPGGHQHRRGELSVYADGPVPGAVQPGRCQLRQEDSGFQKIPAPISVEDASLGLYSATQASKGVQLIQPFGDGITDIITGRRPLSDLDGLVKG
jgi:hypothetical protein